ncbi:MAG TPA: amidohydrolase family protein [Chitinophagaceae bacterium]|nr:amidohydrolase family protein [Chitinophagaceae bacterium]
MEKMPFFFNAHAHCFTIEHVPNNFTKGLTWFSGLLTIRWIKKHKIIRWLIYTLNRPTIKSILKFFSPSLVQALPRLLTFAEFYDITTQKAMIDELRSYYPMSTKFVLLTMDMEFMAAGQPFKKLESQLNEIAALKASPAYKNVIYPFVFADPRRADVTRVVTERLEDKEAPFQGIKIYPALGYYPFDERLKDIYLYAVEHNTPITTHCIKGSVYYRGKKTDDPTYMVHPYTHKPLPFEKPVDFSASFTHPYNYECLLNPALLHTIWNDAGDIDLSRLKICLGHFGGEDEWLKYMEQSWLPDRDFINGSTGSLDVMKNIWYDEEATYDSPGKKAYSWFSVICDMIRTGRYPNLYADISYTLCEVKILPLLKILLETDEAVADKVLFGTDFYVVSKAGADREMSLYVRGYLGEALFKKIAYDNPKKFLNL